MNPLAEWQNFYIIVGSAAGALIGLQFVTMAIIVDIPIGGEESQSASVFSTPTVVHFGTVLLLAAVLVMPWHNIVAAAIVWSIAGLFGTVYTIWTAWRMRRSKGYQPVLEDWFFRTALPLAGYGVLAASAYLPRFAVRTSLSAVAAAVLLLLFLGIHSAWDNVTYLVLEKKRESH